MTGKLRGANAILPALITGTGLTREIPADRAAAAVRYIPAGRPGTMAEVPATALFVASVKASFVNGVALLLDAGSRAVH